MTDAGVIEVIVRTTFPTSTGTKVVQRVYKLDIGGLLSTPVEVAMTEVADVVKHQIMNDTAEWNKERTP